MSKARSAPLYRWSVLLLMAGMPWHEIFVRLWPATRFWDDLIILACAGSLAIDAVRKRALPVPALLAPMGAFLGVALFSGWLNGLPAAQVFVGIRALFPGMVVGLAAAQLSRDDLRTVLRVLAIGGGLAAAYGIASYIALRSWGGRLWMPTPPRNLAEAVLLYPYQCGGYPQGWRLAGSFLNDNFLGDWLGMLVPLAFFLGAHASDRRVRFSYLLGAAAMTVALAWTFSRAAYLAFFVALVVHAWRTDRRVLVLGPIMILTALLVAQPGDTYRFQHLRKTEGGRVAAVRKATVQASNPIIGRGPGTTGVMDMHYARITAQTGLLGLLAFGWLLAACVSPALRARPPATQGRETGTVLLTAMLPMLVGAFGGDVWEIPQLAYTFWTLAGLLRVVSGSGGSDGATLPDPIAGEARSAAAGGTAAAAAAAPPARAAAGC